MWIMNLAVLVSIVLLLLAIAAWGRRAMRDQERGRVRGSTNPGFMERLFGGFHGPGTGP